MTRLAIISLSCLTLGQAALAQAPADGAPRAAFFADAVWSYIVEACPAAVAADPAVNADIVTALGASMLSQDAGIVAELEAASKNLASYEMTEADKRSAATVIVGAVGVQYQVTYQSALTNEVQLAAQTYLQDEAQLRDRAAAGLAMMQCLWPTKQDVTASAGPSAFGQAGEDMWRDMAKSVYVSACKIDYLGLSQAVLDADFAAVPKDARATYWSMITATHAAKLAPTHAADCEDFS